MSRESERGLPALQANEHGPRPETSWARGYVIVLLCTLGLVLYLDRVVMGQALKPIQDEFKLSNEQMAWVAIAFTIAYGLFEIPTGHWGDRIGPRRVLTRIVLWWSTFTVLTAGAWSFGSLVLVRFAFGAGEAGAYPNAARVIRRWFPPTERARVQGLLTGFSQIGAVLSPLLAQLIIAQYGWRWAFVTFGLVGAIWVAIFWFWFRDEPADHSSVSLQELDTIRAGGAANAAPSETHAFPWSKLNHRNPWLLGFIIATASFVAYIYNTWYSKYLQSARGFDGNQASYAFAILQGTSAAGIFAGGWIGDHINRTGSRALNWRRLLGFTGLGTAATIQFFAHWSGIPWLCITLAATSLFIMYLHHASWWSTVIDTGGRSHTGALFGFCNGLGVVGGASAQYFFGWFADWRGRQGFTGRDQFDPAFMVCAVVLFCGACAWLAVREIPEEKE